MCQDHRDDIVSSTTETSAREAFIADRPANRPTHWVGAVVGNVMISMVRFYQRGISPLLGKNCRYEPTCSEYFVLAVQKYGALRGAWKGFWRIMRCHPFRPGGFDPP